MPAFEIDSAKFSDGLKAMLRATGKDAGEALKQEGRLFLQDVVSLTPPTGKSPIKESFNVQRRAGEKAVATDIRKVFKNPMELHMVKTHPQLQIALSTYLAGGKLGQKRAKALGLGNQSPSENATALLRRIGVKMQIVPAATPALHQSMRGAGGRTLKRSVMVLQPKSIETLIKQKQKLVGKEKAGWCQAADGLGVKLPAWITRHRSPGLWIDDTAKPDLQSITLGNLVPYAQAHGGRLQVIKRAMDRRVESMERRLEHILRKNFR